MQRVFKRNTLKTGTVLKTQKKYSLFINTSQKTIIVLSDLINTFVFQEKAILGHFNMRITTMYRPKSGVKRLVFQPKHWVFKYKTRKLKHQNMYKTPMFSQKMPMFWYATRPKHVTCSLKFAVQCFQRPDNDFLFLVTVTLTLNPVTPKAIPELLCPQVTCTQILKSICQTVLKLSCRHGFSSNHPGDL